LLKRHQQNGCGRQAIGVRVAQNVYACILVAKLRQKRKELYADVRFSSHSSSMHNELA
jgi:hypothetical protein